jgi:large-conductance mechanosensitive channel
MKAWKSFKHFLKEYRIIGISIGFVVAIAASNFIQSIVNDIVLPLLRPLVSKGSIVWEDMILSLGPVNLRIGSFLSTFFNLLLILLLLYWLIVKVLKWKPKK